MAKCIRYSLMVSAFALYLAGGVLDFFNVMLVGILILFFHNIVYCCEKLKCRIIFLLFNITTFVFLYIRPVIDLFRGEAWWSDFSTEAVRFTLLVLFANMLFLFFGALLSEAVLQRKEKNWSDKISKAPTDRYGGRYRENLQFVSMIMFYVAICCFFLVEVDKLSYMSGKEYIEFFTTYTSRLPRVITVFADTMPFFLCIFLATMPPKSMTFPPLCLYLLSALPSLKIGLRNPIVLNAIFIFLYYFLRDAMENTRKWIGWAEKLLIAIVTPVGVVFLGAYNYIREGTQMTNGGGLWNIIVDFLHKQGVSFNILNIAYDKMPIIESFGQKNYTFGSFIEYLQHGALAQMLFGASSLGVGNNVVRATQGNSFAHAMSYAALGDTYLEGHGYGSSYVLETYFDYGWIGMALFSLLLGFLMIYFVYWFRKNCWSSALVLIALTEIFLTPRSAALEWSDFVISIPFLFAALFSHFGAGLCVKSYSPLLRGYQPSRCMKSLQ